MRQLERARQRDDEWDVVIAETALTIRLSVSLHCLEQCRAAYWSLRYATCEGRVVVDVVLQSVEEGIVNEVDRTIDVFFHAKVELEWSSGLVAGRERDVLEVASRIRDMLAGAESQYVHAMSSDSITYDVLFKQLTGIASPAL